MGSFLPGQWLNNEALLCGDKMSDSLVAGREGPWADWRTGQTLLAPKLVSENLLYLNFLKLLWIPPYLSVQGESDDYCGLIKKYIFLRALRPRIL